MAIEDIADWIEFTERNVSRVPNVPGIFELADLSRRIIYLNRATKLSMALEDIRVRPTICLMTVRYFRISLNPNLLEGLKNRLLEFCATTSESFPQCNRMRDFPFRTLSA